MTFTDDDLRRIKLDIEQGYLIEPYAVKGLIARMETSERLNAAYALCNIVPLTVRVEEAYYAWRKSKGE